MSKKAKTKIKTNSIETKTKSNTNINNANSNNTKEEKPKTVVTMTDLVPKITAFSRKACKKILRWLTKRHRDQGGITEIRVIADKSSKRIWSAYIDGRCVSTIVKMIAPVTESPREKILSGERARDGEANFYFTLNAVNPALLARSPNEFSSCKGTANCDIVAYSMILIDVDAVRPSGISSTDKEKAAAWSVACKVLKFLHSRGVKPLVADSGNGVHLLIPIVPRRDVAEAAAEIHQFLKMLDSKFSTDRAKIDTGVYNPGRICKLYGTKAVKGPDTPDRPHRYSTIDVSDPPDDVDLFKIFKDELAAMKLAQTKATSQCTEDREWPPIPDDAMPRDIVLPRLRSVTQNDSNQWKACCPSHPDSRPSLSISECPDGVLLLKCFSGPHCDGDSICTAIGLSLDNLLPTAYALRRSGRKRPDIGSAPVSTSVDPFAPHDPKFRELTRQSRLHPDRRRRLRELAKELGVSTASLDALRVGWSEAKGGRWVTPERDNQKRVVGVSYRLTDGQRRTENGSRRGLMIPYPLANDGTVYVCEGMSDTAAMLSSGRCAIGRPAAQVSDLVRVWITRMIIDHLNGRRVVIVGDRDDVGATTAHDLAQWLELECGRQVLWALPQRGHKDVRAQWIAEGKVKLMLHGKNS